jgi:hypothetical protein
MRAAFGPSLRFKSPLVLRYTGIRIARRADRVAALDPVESQSRRCSARAIALGPACAADRSGARLR